MLVLRTTCSASVLAGVATASTSDQCSPFYPHNAIRTNTVFEVIKAENAGRTAWADKHPAYDLVNGPSGKGVDDLYNPEITNVDGFDNTISVVCTVQNGTPVLTSQVAATILKSLGIDPNELESVRKEGISVLPFVFDDAGSEHE